MNANTRNGLFALLVIGCGVAAYRYRASIQRALESRGIHTPLDRTGDVIDTIRSGVAKLAGRTEHRVREVRDDLKRTG